MAVRPFSPTPAGVAYREAFRLLGEKPPLPILSPPPFSPLSVPRLHCVGTTRGLVPPPIPPLNVEPQRLSSELPPPRSPLVLAVLLWPPFNLSASPFAQ